MYYNKLLVNGKNNIIATIPLNTLQMKNKRITYLVVFLSLSAIFSCKRTYTCECVTTYPNTKNTTTTSTDMGKMKRKDAWAQCNDRSTPGSYSGVTAKITCNLIAR